MLRLAGSKRKRGSGARVKSMKGRERRARDETRWVNGGSARGYERERGSAWGRACERGER